MTSLSVDEQRLEGVDDGAVPGHVAHVDVVVDRRRHVAETISSRRCWPIFMATARAPMLSSTCARQRLRHHAARRGFEHQRGGVGGGQPVVEPVQPEIGDRRHIDQHFRDHHEQDREHQQLAGQAEPRRARRRGSPACRVLRIHAPIASADRPDPARCSAEAAQQADDAPHPGARQTRREIGDCGAFSDLATGSDMAPRYRPCARMLSPALIASVQVVISSPASRADDGGAEDAAALVGHHLDVAARSRARPARGRSRDRASAAPGSPCRAARASSSVRPTWASSGSVKVTRGIRSSLTLTGRRNSAFRITRPA